MDLENKEWLDLVLRKLDELKNEIVDVKLNFVKQTDFAELREAVRELELSKSKIWGIAFGVSSAVTVVGWAVGVFVLYLTGHGK